MEHSENDQVESIKFWLVQPQNLLIIRTTKCLVDPKKYLVDSTKLFSCFNQPGIFGRFNQKIDFNQLKFVDIQENTCWFKKNFFLREETTGRHLLRLNKFSFNIKIFVLSEKNLVKEMFVLI